MKQEVSCESILINEIPFFDAPNSFDPIPKQPPDSSRRRRTHKNISPHKFLFNIKDNTKTRSVITDDVNDDSDVTVNSSNTAALSLVFTFVGFVFKAIAFQTTVLLAFLTFPIWFMYSSYVFFTDPFAIIRRVKACLLRRVTRLLRLCLGNVKCLLCKWVHRNKSTWSLCMKIAWGLFSSLFVAFVLVGLVVFAVAVSGVMMKWVVDEPVRILEELNFDYTSDSPMAFVPIMSCPDDLCLECRENIEFGNVAQSRVIPLDHNLLATVSLNMPESDYNTNLGIFQLVLPVAVGTYWISMTSKIHGFLGLGLRKLVPLKPEDGREDERPREEGKFAISDLEVRVDYLSHSGKSLASKTQPCMLQFKSQPIRLLMTILKLAPLITGYSAESQTLDIKFKGYTELEIPTSCLRVVLEPRAEFAKTGGVPEIYTAYLKLESQLPLLKRIIWSWKATIFVWTSIVMFTMGLIFMMLCCTPVIVPWFKPRAVPSINNGSRVRGELDVGSGRLVQLFVIWYESRNVYHLKILDDGRFAIILMREQVVTRFEVYWDGQPAMQEEVQTCRNQIAQLNNLIAEMEAFDDPGEVFDRLMGLRDDVRVEDAKLMGLNDLIAWAEEEFEMKEAQLEVADG
ncbi:adipose-regulatory protein, seipin [Tanacetum coccineum]